MQSKKCTKCSINKPLSEFYKSRTIQEGYQFWCKTCDKEYHRLKYESNPRDYIIRSTDYRKLHPTLGRQYVKKYSNTKKGKLNREKYMSKYKQSAHGKLVIKAINRRAYLRRKQLLLKGIK